jgi:hypothetical protein
MSTGFALRELRVTGRGVQDAVLTFADGLNVIVGPSDTGKTYVAQCLSFLLGSGTPPKEIPEAVGYETAQVRIAARRDGSEHTLTRRLDGAGNVEHEVGDRPADQLRPRHDAKREDTLPAFLLGLSGLSGVVRTTVAGQTRPLAFSDVARLFIVDEQTVIGEGSPVLSGQYTTPLVERRVFRALLTGADDAGVVALEKPERARGHRAGRREVLEELDESVRRELGRLGVTGSTEEAERRVEEWSTGAELAVAQLERAQQAAAPVEQQRRAVLGELRRTRSRHDHRRELQTRFALLREQYESDLERLGLVAQAGGRLEQLTEERCPVCGAAVEHQQHAHRDDHVGAGEIAASCRAEAEKIGVLIRDLHSTIEANDAELARLEVQEEEQSRQLADVDRELSGALQPRVGAASRALREAEAARSRELQAVTLLQQATDIKTLLADAKATVVPTRAAGSTEGASTGEAEAFSRRVQALLEAWHFPDVDRVTWSERNQDIIVSGRARSSYGKGKRAIMRAAFNLGLLRVLTDEERPSPGLVVIDSPLVVYREPDAGEEAFPPAVKQHFYEAVADDFKDAQVVILENEEPPASVRSDARVEVLTGTASGRRGFFP